MCRYEAVRDPAKTLAELMKKDLGVDVDEKALALFIKHRWASVSTCAHRIHETDPQTSNLS